jgi:hypothetical protein
MSAEPEMSMYADDLQDSRPFASVIRGRHGQSAAHQDRNRDLMLKIVMSSMPLAGLVLGVVALALWNVS